VLRYIHKSFLRNIEIYFREGPKIKLASIGWFIMTFESVFGAHARVTWAGWASGTKNIEMKTRAKKNAMAKRKIR
jgi:hypothetical protein